MSTLFEGQKDNEQGTQVEKVENTQELEIVKTLENVLTQAKKFMPAATKAVETTKARLSVFSEINDDETDGKANDTLVKARKTFTDLKEARLKISGPLDNIKALLMGPEKEISTDPNADTEYNRVKGLRNQYNNKKVQEAEKRRIEAEKKRRTEEEKARIVQAIKTSVTDGVSTLLVNLSDGLSKVMTEITLDNFEELKSRVFVKPSLKSEIWAKWFEIPYNRDLVPIEEYREIIDNLSSNELSYDIVQGNYLEKASPIVEKKKAELPELKQKLEKIAAQEKENAAAAEVAKRELKEKQERQAQEQREAAEAQAKKEKEAAEAEANQKKLEANFEEQVVLTEVPNTASGKKVHYAILNCEPKDIVAIMSKVMFACFNHPKFKGHIKTDKQGNPKYKTLADGVTMRPEYEPFIEQLLTFYAGNCTHDIEGIRIATVHETIQKKK